MHSTGLFAVLLIALVGTSYGCLSNPGQLPCDLNPCLNGATCTNLDVQSYTCACTSSYQGTNCENLIASPCASAPCQNGGTCSVVADFYFCTCEAAKYAGYNCELTVSPCTSGPCLNGGTCNQVGDTFDFTCDCPAGLIGDTCDTIETTTTVAPTPASPSTRVTTTVGPPFSPTTELTTEKMTTTTSNTQCPNNQEYSFCASACTKTCTTPDHQFCVNVCRQGCACPFEFPILDEASGVCVTLENCPAQSTTAPTTVPTSTLIILPCDAQPCQNNGFCINPTPPQTDAYCVCEPGYTGVFCESLIGSSPTTTVATAATTEDDSMSGSGSGMGPTTASWTTTASTTTASTTTASTTADPTISTPTTTASTTSAFTYTTRPTTTAAPVSLCDSNPCLNGGVCFDDVIGVSFTCSCNNRYKGDLCETFVPKCDENPCENGGTCTNVLAGFQYHCTCSERYTGTDCETIVPACDSSPCQNGGSCTDIDGGLTYECTCPFRYEGTDCETQILPCEPNPCQNGGTCTDRCDENLCSDAAYTCACNEGYNGTDCENDFTCSGNLDKCLPIMSDFSRNFTDSAAYCASLGYHLAYIEDSAKYNMMINYVRSFWQTEFAGFNIDTRNHWVGMQYLGNRQAQNLGGDDTTPYTIFNWYPLGYPTSLTSFPDNDRMVMLVSITDESTIFQGLRNIDPYSTYYAICQDPTYISYL